MIGDVAAAITVNVCLPLAACSMLREVAQIEPCLAPVRPTGFWLLASDMAAAAVVPSSYRCPHTSLWLGQALFSCAVALGQSLTFGRHSGDMRAPRCRGGSVVRVHASCAATLSVFQKQYQCRVPVVRMPTRDTPLSFEAPSGHQHLGCCVLTMFHARATVACDRAAPICRSIVPHPRPPRVAWQKGNAKACESSSPSQWGTKAVSVAVGSWRCQVLYRHERRGDVQGPGTSTNQTILINREFSNPFLFRVFIWGNQFSYDSGTLLRYVPIRAAASL